MATMYGEVLTTERLTPSLVRVVLGGPGLDAFEMPADTDAYVNVAIAPAGAPYGPVFDPREVARPPPAGAWLRPGVATRCAAGTPRRGP